MKITKRKILIGIIAGVILIVAGFILFGRNNKPAYQLIKAQRGNLTQEVSVTGRVEAVQNLDLSFEKSGKVTSISAAVGAEVSAGAILATQNNSELSAQLRAAQATLEKERIKLAELERGTRPEEITIKQAELDNAKQNLANEYTDSINVLTEAYNKADEAIRTKVSSQFSTNYAPFELVYDCGGSSVANTVQYLRADAEISLNAWRDQLSTLNAQNTITMEAALTTQKQTVSTLQIFIEELAKTLISNSGCFPSPSNFSTYQTNVSAAKTLLASSASLIEAQIQSISTQKLTVSRVNSELTLLLAGSTTEQIDAQRAMIKSQEAAVAQIAAQIEKGIIRSPIHGVVVKNDAKLGMIAGAQENLISVISKNRLQIKAFVPEADIAKVALNNNANLTLDAYGSEIDFAAKIVSISPGETVIEGVSTYETIFEFIQDDERTKPGMTANLNIITQIKNDVLVLPQRAVISRNGDKIVNVRQADGSVVEVKIETGLRGSDGNIEITSGLSGGMDIAVISEK